MDLISFVLRYPVKKSLPFMRNLSKDTATSHLKRSKMQRFKGFSGGQRRYILELSHRETCDSNTDNSDEPELNTDYALNFINAILFWKRKGQE